METEVNLKIITVSLRIKHVNVHELIFEDALR